jgi:hypothetical protein
MVESSSMAFLRALEPLDPRERTVLVMCDALGDHVHDAAATLDLTSTNAKGALQSARRRMIDYDLTHVAPTKAVQAHTAEMLRHCLAHLEQHNAVGLEKLFAMDAQALFDAGGEFVAPLAPIIGSDRVAKLLLKFVEGANPMQFAFRMLNGQPAALCVSGGRPRWARRFVFRIETRDGLVSELQMILASAKLTAVRFDPA